MFESMYAAKGVGLAAPQIGIGKRIAVIDTSLGENHDEKLVLINPEIVEIEGKQVGEEGCLSIPGFREQVRARATASPSRAERQGRVVREDRRGTAGARLLHETDHLNGVLYISHISVLKRDLIRRKIRKLAKSRRVGLMRGLGIAAS